VPAYISAKIIWISRVNVNANSDSIFRFDKMTADWTAPIKIQFSNLNQNKNQPRKNAVVEYLDYQIPVTQLKGRKGNGDMQAAKRD